MQIYLYIIKKKNQNKKDYRSEVHRIMNIQTKSKRITWLDGIKGIACILVFFHHFFLAFYPATYFGEKGATHLSGMDTQFAQSPLSVVINGNFMVALFCVISGMIVSLQVMSLAENKEKLSEIVFKRYFRLMLPVVPVGIVVYFMLKYGFFTNLDAAVYTQSNWLSTFYTTSISFYQTLQSLFIQIWFYSDAKLANSFWMLSQLFYGCFLSILLSVISWKARKHTWVIYLITFLFFFQKEDLLMAFVLGTLLAWFYKNRYQSSQNFLGVICLIAGIFLGGFPTGVKPTNIYRFLNFETYVVWHVFGAALLVYGVCNLRLLQHFFSMRLFKMLGNISYAVYIIQIPILFSLSTEIFILCYRRGMEYWQSTVVSFLVTIVALIALSYLYHRYIERLCNFVQDKIMVFFIAENKK